MGSWYVYFVLLPYETICEVDSRSTLAIAMKVESETLGVNCQRFSQFSSASGYGEGPSGYNSKHSKKSPYSIGSRLGSSNVPAKRRRGEFAKERLVGFRELAEVEKTPAAGFR